jgi:hypothetical protein
MILAMQDLLQQHGRREQHLRLRQPRRWRPCPRSLQQARREGRLRPPRQGRRDPLHQGRHRPLGRWGRFPTPWSRPGRRSSGARGRASNACSARARTASRGHAPVTSGATRRHLWRPRPRQRHRRAPRLRLVAHTCGGRVAVWFRLIHASPPWDMVGLGGIKWGKGEKRERDDYLVQPYSLMRGILVGSRII